MSVGVAPTLSQLTHELRPCAFCGGAIALRLDKAGRPYMRCPYCGTMCFLKSYAALAGFLLSSDHVAKDRAAWMRAVEVLQADMMGVKPLDPSPANPATMRPGAHPVAPHEGRQSPNIPASAP